MQVYNFDPMLEDAARDCGATNWEVYRYITIPLLWPGIFSAAIFAFLLSWGKLLHHLQPRGINPDDSDFHLQRYAVGSSPLYPAIATVVFIPAFFSSWRRVPSERDRPRFGLSQPEYTGVEIPSMRP